MRLAAPTGAATAQQRRHCASGGAACPAEIPVIPASGGCITSATPTITSSGSPDPGPKPSRSRTASRRSCVTTSSWNSSQEKTLITHASTGAARFLGYEITIQHSR